MIVFRPAIGLAEVLSAFELLKINNESKILPYFLLLSNFVFVAVENGRIISAAYLVLKGPLGTPHFRSFSSEITDKKYTEVQIENSKEFDSRIDLLEKFKTYLEHWSFKKLSADYMALKKSNQNCRDLSYINDASLSSQYSKWDPYSDQDFVFKEKSRCESFLPSEDSYFEFGEKKSLVRDYFGFDVETTKYIAMIHKGFESLNEFEMCHIRHALTERNLSHLLPEAKLDFLSSTQKRQLRQSARYKTKISATICGDKHSLNLSITNVSKSGFSIACKTDTWKIGQDIEIYINTGKRKLKMKAKIVVKSANHLGLVWKSPTQQLFELIVKELNQFNSPSVNKRLEKSKVRDTLLIAQVRV